MNDRFGWDARGWDDYNLDLLERIRERSSQPGYSRNWNKFLEDIRNPGKLISETEWNNQNYSVSNERTTYSRCERVACEAIEESKR